MIWYFDSRKVVKVVLLHVNKKFWGGGGYTDRKQDDLISLLPLFINKENRLKT
jgi:hypothetical protein